MKQWTTERKSKAVIDILKCKSTAVEVAWFHELRGAEFECCIEQAQSTIGNAFRARPRDMIWRVLAQRCALPTVIDY